MRLHPVERSDQATPDGLTNVPQRTSHCVHDVPERFELLVAKVDDHTECDDGRTDQDRWIGIHRQVQRLDDTGSNLQCLQRCLHLQDDDRCATEQKCCCRQCTENSHHLRNHRVLLQEAGDLLHYLGDRYLGQQHLAVHRRHPTFQGDVGVRVLEQSPTGVAVRMGHVVQRQDALLHGIQHHRSSTSTEQVGGERQLILPGLSLHDCIELHHQSVVQILGLELAGGHVLGGGGQCLLHRHLGTADVHTSLVEGTQHCGTLVEPDVRQPQCRSHPGQGSEQVGDADASMRSNCCQEVAVHGGILGIEAPVLERLCSSIRQRHHILSLDAGQPEHGGSKDR